MTISGQAVPAPAAILVNLDDPACEAPALAGNKAATLAVLRRAGFQVPPGMVVCADALRGIEEELPANVRAALRNVPEQLGPGPWAVRSSSTAEDTEQASFAGQFETVLGVNVDGLADAVRRVWRSGLSDRAKAYSGERGSGSMAVLIQPMIAAEAAGVAFTVDPISGRRRMVIEAVAGLGEHLVSGSATPERWAVEEDRAIEAPSAATVVNADQARAIGDLARRVEEYLGRPQDIEWAIAGGSVSLLQARPITALPSAAPELIPIPIEVPPGYWTRDTFHEPVPISPFGKVLLTEQILKVFPTAFAEFGILLDRAEVAFIGGWMYRREVPLGAPPPSRGRPSAPPPLAARDPHAPSSSDPPAHEGRPASDRIGSSRHRHPALDRRMAARAPGGDRAGPGTRSPLALRPGTGGATRPPHRGVRSSRPRHGGDRLLDPRLRARPGLPRTARLGHRQDAHPPRGPVDHLD